MKNIGEYIVCRKETCKIIDIQDDYYVLEPINDKTLKMKVPVNSKILRDLIKKEDIDYYLKKIPSVTAIKSSDRMMENTYKELMQSGTYEDLIKVIKTTYLRNEKRKNNNKKISDKDDSYFTQAEKYLYSEFSDVLGFSFEQTKEYVINMVSKYN